MIDVESLIKEGFAVLDPLPPGAEGDWNDVIGRVERPSHRRGWALAVGVLTAVVAGVIAVVALLPAGESGGPSTAAAAVLLDAARTAARQPATAPPGPGQFIYTKSKGAFEMVGMGNNGHPYVIVFRPFTREDWLRPDGSGRIHEVDGHLQFPTPADRTVYKNDSRKYIDGLTSNEKIGPGLPNYNELNNVPTDPAKLKPLIENRKLEGGPPGDAETFTIIGDLLRETDGPPAVRSALYTIASQLPGVQLIGATHDQLGRPGTGVAYVSTGLRDELIFDPQTSALLAEQTTVVNRSLDNPFPPGTVIGWTSYLASGVVNSDSTTTSATP